MEALCFPLNLYPPPPPPYPVLDLSGAGAGAEVGRGCSYGGQVLWSREQKQKQRLCVGLATKPAAGAVEDYYSSSSSSSQFVKPLKEMYPPLPCRICKGSGKTPCSKCEGRGSLRKGGYQKKNPLDMSRVIGSKWTAMEQTFGWRHFFVNSKQRGLGNDWFLEMVATCDESSRFWVNAHNLKDRKRWSVGWLQKTEILSAKGIEIGYATQCKACKGERFSLCPLCRAKGLANSNQLDIIEI
ncbi:hypothetical protein O6H91_12G032800 [Diphasiastrum complanatum]|uniref:Uncharacterized protein n=1 Tax=Diphasiastrum complanatum TaxID=34168 RepID=A0ACC2C082_DIPCM|nr:hypothetical protein O6H91_12G032800 [Diphasiastrum complanatum]